MSLLTMIEHLASKAVPCRDDGTIPPDVQNRGDRPRTVPDIGVGGAHMVDKPGDNREWAEENAVAFAAQARWHELHPHPLEDILVDPRVVSLTGQRTTAPRT